MSQQFCKRYVESIFNKYDDDRSNVLTRTELKKWQADQAKSRPLNKKQAIADFQKFMREIDENGDNKIDRWELFDYCIKYYRQQ